MCIDLDTERRIKENDLKYIVQGSMNNGMQTRLEIRAHRKGTVGLRLQPPKQIPRFFRNLQITPQSHNREKIGGDCSELDSIKSYMGME
jgi:hypothetical protein